MGSAAHVLQPMKSRAKVNISSLSCLSQIFCHSQKSLIIIPCSFLFLFPVLQWGSHLQLCQHCISWCSTLPRGDFLHSISNSWPVGLILKSYLDLTPYTFARNISMYIFFNIVTSYVSLAYKLMGKLFHLKEINLFFKTLPKRTKKNLNWKIAVQCYKEIDHS
jgi:hypothetical protein